MNKIAAPALQSEKLNLSAEVLYDTFFTFLINNLFYYLRFQIKF